MKKYKATISKQTEHIADIEVAAQINVVTYSKALAKHELLSLYLSNSTPPNFLELRAMETFPNYYNIILDNFNNEMKVNESHWIEEIKKRISDKYDSHLSFSERMKAIGINDFSYELVFYKHDYDYKNEIDTMTRLMNELWLEEINDNWEEDYGDYKESKYIVDNFDETNVDINNDTEKAIEYALALESIGQIDKALIKYDEILSKNNFCVDALFNKGLLLLNQKDTYGIELIKKAIDLDINFIEYGLSVSSEYLHNNEMFDEEDELVEWALNKEKNRIEKTESRSSRLNL